MPAAKRTMKRSLATVAAMAVVATGAIQPGVAQAQVPGVAQTLPLITPNSGIPGVTALPDLPGLAGTAGGAPADGQLPTDGQLYDLTPLADGVGEIVPAAGDLDSGGVLDTPTSTNPTCAPMILVDVPGTFGMSRAWDPNKETGIIPSLLAPLRAELGDNLSTTVINYPADAGVKGVAYARSVQYGAEKAIATIEDIQNRCDGSKVILTGFSQGADVAGDAATMIGNKQTGIAADTIAAVILFSDPQRSAGAPVLPDTTSNVPRMPSEVSNAVEKVMEDPSLAQLQITAGDIGGLAGMLSQASDTSTKDDEDETTTRATTSTTSRSSDKSTTERTTGRTTGRTTEESTPSTTSTPASGGGLSDLFSQGRDVAGPVAVDYNLVSEETPKLGTKEQLFTRGLFGQWTWNEIGPRCSGEDAEKAMKVVQEKGKHPINTKQDQLKDCLRDLKGDKLPESIRLLDKQQTDLVASNFKECSDLSAVNCADKNREYSWDFSDEAKEGAEGVIRIGSDDPENLKPPVLVTLSDEQMEAYKLEEGVVWASPDNRRTMTAKMEAYSRATGTEYNMASATVDGSSMESEHLDQSVDASKVSQLYRYGGCGDQTYAECHERFNGLGGEAALDQELSELPDPPSEEDQRRAEGIAGGDLLTTGCADLNVEECASSGASSSNDGLSMPKVTQVSNNTEDESKDEPADDAPPADEPADDAPPAANPNEDGEATGDAIEGTEDAGGSTVEPAAPAGAAAPAGGTTTPKAAAPAAAPAGGDTNKSSKSSTTTPKAAANDDEDEDDASAGSSTKRTSTRSSTAKDSDTPVCSTVVHIGDSLSEGDTRKKLEKGYEDAGVDAIINANGGRSYKTPGAGDGDSGTGLEAIEDVRDNLGSDADDACWVMALGTNDVNNEGAAAADSIADGMKAVGTAGHFFFPKVYADGDAIDQDGQDAFNDALGKLSSDNENVTVIDWAKDDDSLLGSDGIHLTAEGQDAFVDGIVEAVADAKATSDDDDSDKGNSVNASDNGVSSLIDGYSAVRANDKSTSSSTSATSGSSSDDEDSDEGAEGDSSTTQEINGVKPITAAPAPGGGLTGYREESFGDLAGAVVSLCVPGDIVCDLPEDSQLARDLITIGTNLEIPGGVGRLLEGDTRMAGLLAIDTVNYIAELSGLPETRLTPETLNTLLKLVGGISLVTAGTAGTAAGAAGAVAGPAAAVGSVATGPGAAAAPLLATAGPIAGGVVATGSSTAMALGGQLLTEAMAELPAALPEVAAQIQDLPAILAALPSAPEQLVNNLGADGLLSTLSGGFTGAGLGDITNLQALPMAVGPIAASLTQDKTGVLEMATNPKYLNPVAHSEAGFRMLPLAEGMDAWSWSQQLISSLNKAVV